MIINPVCGIIVVTVVGQPVNVIIDNIIELNCAAPGKTNITLDDGTLYVADGELKDIHAKIEAVA